MPIGKYSDFIQGPMKNNLLKEKYGEDCADSFCQVSIE